MMIWVVYQYFEEDDKGFIELGKFVDFVILFGDFFLIDLEDFEMLCVIEMIKEGKMIYDWIVDCGNWIELGSSVEWLFVGVIWGMVIQYELVFLFEVLKDNFIVCIGFMVGCYINVCVLSVLMVILMGLDNS